MPPRQVAARPVRRREPRCGGRPGGGAA
jgi:hypothetical protein